MYRPTIRTEFTASPAALARIAILYPRPVFEAPLLTAARALADRIPAQRLREVATANERTAKGKRASAGDAVRLNKQAAGLRGVVAQLVAANDNGRKAVAA